MKGTILSRSPRQVHRIWQALPAAPEHIPAIAGNMREEDRREVWASHRHTPLQALENSLRRSELAWTCAVLSDDGWQPAFMWGVVRCGSLISEVGAPWLLGTPLVRKVSKEFLRQCPAYVEQMQSLFPRLENYIHADNHLSIRWLKWCGFTMETDVPELINDEDFYLFWRGVHV